MFDKSQVLLTAIRDEFNKEMANPAVDLARAILDPHSNLKKAAKLLKKAEELNQAIASYRDPPKMGKKSAA